MMDAGVLYRENRIDDLDQFHHLERLAEIMVRLGILGERSHVMRVDRGQQNGHGVWRMILGFMDQSKTIHTGKVARSNHKVKRGVFESIARGLPICQRLDVELFSLAQFTSNLINYPFVVIYDQYSSLGISGVSFH